MFLKCLLALTALAGVANAQLTGGNLVFSEILFKPSNGARYSFIELYNPTGATVDTSTYSVCNASGDCTQLGGTLNAAGYYVLCADISTNMFCRKATTLQIHDLSQLVLMQGTAQVDSVSAGSIPTGQSYVRGLSSNLLAFQFSPIITSGIGFLGGRSVTSSPSATPISVPGITYLAINELSTQSNNRFVEIAFASTTSIGDYLVTFYDSAGAVLSTSPLSAFNVGTGNNGMIFATLNYSHSNGVIGVALTGDGFTWDFVSKGGAIQANGGAASGETSENLGSSAIYQQRGSGCELNTFSWVAAGSSTKGRVNANQFPTCEVIVFINEVNYGEASGNYLEVAYTQGLPAADLSSYVVEFYVQATGQPLGFSYTLDQFTPGASSNGLTFATISLDIARRGLIRRNLASRVFDGFSLTNKDTGEVLSFYSVTGSNFNGNGGGAAGQSTEAFVTNSALGRNFGGFTGSGCGQDEFAFGANGLTPGAANNGQTIACSSDTVSTNVLTAAPTTAQPTPSPTPFPTPAPTPNTNECLNGEAKCSEKAICTDTNTPPGFTCTCAEGFTGDGNTCIDIDECVVDSPCAAVGGFCVDEDGSFKCGCLPGFTGDGTTCTDINECSSNPCGPNASCSNSAGSFGCACNSGFSGNPFDPTTGCTDVDECSMNPCASNAFCTNIVNGGGFVCACNTGFTGDGTSSCTDTNECASNPCDANAACLNTAGGFTCTCNSGYNGNGFSCSLTITPSPTPAPNSTPIPTTATPVDASDPPSMYPTVTNQPSMSFGPSITSNPSSVPSLSDQPSGTNPPSEVPSLSLMPSKTDMPSSTPSLSDAPT